MALQLYGRSPPGVAHVAVLQRCIIECWNVTLTFACSMSSSGHTLQPFQLVGFNW
jgi:hypothetical protein